MSIPEILKELTPYTGRFPMAAMRAAIQQREAITPELLRVLETVAENPEDYARRDDHMLHVFALYLLAQFREKRAYPFVVKMFSAPGEIPFDLVGDTVTERLNRIFASVYDGNPAPLQGLVENEEVNEYVRDAALDAFVALAHTGQMPRDESSRISPACFTESSNGAIPTPGTVSWSRLLTCPRRNCWTMCGARMLRTWSTPGALDWRISKGTCASGSRAVEESTSLWTTPSLKWNGGPHSIRRGRHPRNQRRPGTPLAKRPHNRRSTRSLGAMLLVLAAAARNTSTAAGRLTRPNYPIAPEKQSQ